MVFRWFVACVLCLVGATALPIAPVLAQPLPQNEATSESPSAASAYGDDELIAILNEADLLSEWVESSGISEQAALVAVLATGDYGSERTQFLDDVSSYNRRAQRVEARAHEIATIDAEAEALEGLIRSLRRDVVGRGRIAEVSQQRAQEARLVLATIEAVSVWRGLSLDPVELAEHRVAAVQGRLEDEVDTLSDTSIAAKSADASIARLTGLHDDLEQVRAVLDTVEQWSVAPRVELALQRNELIGAMGSLHRARQLRPTLVGGLSTVTLDAYVQGAATLADGCPVDWSLLAGIGRVESRHGTIGGSTVQVSGLLTKPILGPLLDGGATKREAAAAVVAAQEEALRLADEEAEAALPVEPVFDSALWGEEPEDEPTQEELDAAVAQAAADRAASSQFDPLLWGDDLPFDEDDEPDAEAPDGDEDSEEVPQFRGNGFAVIHDSDNGRLDGNNRWDRAVGPMQFIPETWAYWETDGNADGAIDPQNLYDSAATAGRFLCHLSRTKGASPYSFVLGYNQSQTYVRNVMAVADAFAASPLPTLKSVG